MNNVDASKYVSQFLVWIKSGKATHADGTTGWEEERTKRRNWYHEKLSKEKIDTLTEEDFGTLIKDLWATLIWSNKDYKVKKLLEDNPFPKMKSSLKDLLYGSEPTEKRWDNFRASIKGLGPSSMSEILAFSNPDQYGIINLKPLSLLPVIGIIAETELKKYSYNTLNGSRYVKLLETLTSVRNILRKNGLPEADLIDTDFFIAYLFYEVFGLYKERDKASKIEDTLGIKRETGRTKEEDQAIRLHPTTVKIQNHEEAECILLKLGQLLGYDTYTPDSSSVAYNESLSKYATLKQLPSFTHEDFIRTVKEIDVIWFEQDFPVMCFEVEHTTGVTSGLLRLYQIRRFDAKLFIIAPRDVNKKYEIEVTTKEPFRSVKDKYCFRSYEELSDFYTLAEKYYISKENFLVRNS